MSGNGLPYLETSGELISRVSDEFVELTGYKSYDLLDKKISQVLSEMLRITCRISDVLSISKESIECFIFTKELFSKEIVVTSISGDYSGHKKYIFKEKSGASLRSKCFMATQIGRHIFLGVALFLIDNGITLLYANDKYLDFFDEPYNKREFSVGRKIHEIVSGWKGSTSEKLWNDILRNGNVYHNEEYMYPHFKKGLTYWNGTIIPIYEDDKLKYALEMTLDITKSVIDRKTVEKQAEIILQQKNELEKALKMKDEFISIISHEFKTPLTVINSAIQVMENLYDNEISDNIRRNLGRIKQNSYRQLRLVNNLLDITRINAGRLKVSKHNIDIVFLTRSITQSVQIYASQRGVILDFKTTLQKKVIGMDDEKYERILLNLLSNAIKFTSQGKRVSVSLSLRNIDKKQKICLRVIDQGVGIPEDKLEYIFERFGQVNNSLTQEAEGTGIGLSLVKLLVLTLDGEICVKSRLNRGSTFTVLLPAVKICEGNTVKHESNEVNNRVIQSAAIELSDIYLP